MVQICCHVTGIFSDMAIDFPYKYVRWFSVYRLLKFTKQVKKKFKRLLHS